jgi:hypothetical protein
LTGSKDPSFVRETSYTYYDNDLLHTVSDNSGAYTVNHYDKNGNLMKVEALRETGVFDVTTYVYDDWNRMVKRIRLVDEEDVADAAEFANMAALKRR